MASSLLTAFDEGGTRFALVTPDGRIKSYDTVTGRLRTSIAAGPSEAHLCAAWLPAAAPSGGGKAAAAGAAAGAAPAPTVLAVGTASGDVTAYDTATAEVRWRASAVNEGGVSCLAASSSSASAGGGGGGGGGKRGAAAAAAKAAAPPPGGRLVSCGADAVVVSLDPQTGEPAPLAPPPAGADGHHHGAAANGHHSPSPSSFRGSKHPVTAAALSADGARALVGATTLALWELAPPASSSSSSSSRKPRRLAKLTGHPLPVRAAAFSPGAGHFALTAARGERGVSVWRASAEALQLPAPGAGGGKRSKSAEGSVVVAAAANLAMDDEAVQLSTSMASGGGAFFAAAVGQRGECLVWRVAPAGGDPSGAVEVVPQAHVRVAGAAAGGESILAAHLEPTAGEDSGVTLLVVRGNPAAPAFERVPIAPRGPGAAGPTPTLELAPAAGGGLLPPTRLAGGGKARAGPAEVLGPDNAGAMVRSRAPAEDHSDEEDSEDESGSEDDEEEDEEEEEEEQPASPGVPSPLRRKRGAPEDEDEEVEEEEGDEEEDEGQTLGARLAALDQQQQQQQQQQKQPAAAARGQGGGGAQANDGSAAAAAKPPPLLAGVRGAAAKADSLAVMLTQALRSGDRALLERCLAVSDARVVNNTARRLVPVDAAALLRAGVERLQSSPRRAASLAGWIRAALVHHAAYLTGAPGAQPVMASLYRTIESRLAAQRALLSLAGRLDLLLASASASAGGGVGAAGRAPRPGADDGPRVLYEESEEEDEEEEVEDAFARVGLEGSDDDDDEDDDDDDDDSDDDGGLVGGSDEDLADGLEDVSGMMEDEEDDEEEDEEDEDADEDDDDDDAEDDSEDD